VGPHHTPPLPNPNPSAKVDRLVFFFLGDFFPEIGESLVFFTRQIRKTIRQILSKVPAGRLTQKYIRMLRIFKILLYYFPIATLG
jgi:hypothetical protein